MKVQKAICKAYVDTPQGQIHYLSAGEGEPLVLLHCCCDAASMWEAVLPILGDMGYRAVAFDIPGHGNSDPPPREPTGPEYASRINEACQLLGINRYRGIPLTGLTTRYCVVGFLSPNPLGYVLVRDRINGNCIL